MIRGMVRMTREEAMEHFEEEYVYKYYVQMDKKAEQYIEENNEILTSEFIETFRSLCKKIKQMQIEGKKEKIAYITFSFGIDNLLHKSHEYMVHAYGSEWFYEDSEECKVMHDLNWLYEFMEDTYNQLVEISKKYIGNITSADLKEVRKSGVISCDVLFRKFAKKAIEKAVEIDEFKEIEKDEVLEIRNGEYKGYNEIIYKIDTGVKSSKDIKNWLEKKDEEDDYCHQILCNLDLSNGDYKGIGAHHTDFSGSDLSNADFEGTSLIDARFNKAKIENVNFKGASLDESNFAYTTVKNSNFVEADLLDSNFEKSELIGCNLADTDFAGSNFQDCIIKDCVLKNANFFESDLENADFSNNDLQGASFVDTNLQGADFSGCNLENATLGLVDLTQAKLEGAKFGNNEIKKVTILACDVDKLNLSKEQKEELTIVDRGK
jgi:uncharacterized protein YjbI with pentapeptide repeats